MPNNPPQFSLKALVNVVTVSAIWAGIASYSVAMAMCVAALAIVIWSNELGRNERFQ